ncbi:MAG: hypothetical protein KGL39_36120 [Patescibacteria group bacterium]|nr:hypothetical protein [Patescibacteria group bacterium]
MAARADGQISAYGRLYPKGTIRLAIEFDNYAYPTPKAQGGRGAEYHFRQAFGMLWPKFEMNEWSNLLIWAWCNYKIITVMGHQRASKTYTVAHLILMDYWASMGNTLTSVATVTFEGLKLRMWGDVMRAVETCAVPNPFRIRSTTNECKIYPLEYEHKAGERFQIHGMSVSRTADSPGRIRGGHADRRRIALDEADNMPDAIEEACVNPLSAPDAKLIRLSNPVEKVSAYGKACEPVGGWSTVDVTDLWWEAKMGGIVLHFDGLQSPNVKAGRTILPYMLTQDSIDMIERMHGRESVQFWALVRGWFPPDGMVSRVFPSGTIEKGKKEIVFDFQPQWCASLDPAFEFDNCVLHLAQLAMPVFGERQYKINCKETLIFKHDASLGAEPKDHQIAHWIMVECRERGIAPNHFIMDTTGNGRGVYAILQKEWSRDVQSVNYGGEATDRNLRGDDNRKCSEIYRLFVSELWFRASEYMKAGFIGGLSNLDPRTTDDLSARRYELKHGTKGQMMQVESKEDLRKRIGRSPDFGDALVQFGELLIRLGTQPGGSPLLQRLKAKSAWEARKQKVLAIGARYSEAKEYSF